MRTEETNQAFQFIVGYIKDNQRAPTHKEISLAVGCSASKVSCILNKLRAMGKIDFTTRSRRNIKVPGYYCTEASSDKRERMGGLSIQERKDLTILARDFGLLGEAGVQETIDACKSYAEGWGYIMRVYENVYMRQ